MVKTIIETEFAYLSAIGMIDFLKDLSDKGKKMIKTHRKSNASISPQIQNLGVDGNDLSLFGGR